MFVTFYRLKTISVSGIVSYSRVIRLALNANLNGKVKVFPNPVTDQLRVSVYAPLQEPVELYIYDGAGRLMRQIHTNIGKGISKITLLDFDGWPTGIYSVKVLAGKELFVNKMVLKKID